MLLPNPRDKISAVFQHGIDSSPNRRQTVAIGCAVVLHARLGLCSAAAAVEYLEGVVAGAQGPRVAARATVDLVSSVVRVANKDYKSAGGVRASQSSKENYFRWPLRDYKH